MKQNLTGKTNLHVNFTLVDYTQMRLDIGSPVSYSATTNLYNYNYLNDTGTPGEKEEIELVVNEGAITIHQIDFDCDSN